MAKRPSLKPAIKALHKIAKEDEDLLERDRALQLIAKLEPLVGEFESVMGYRMGRHAPREAREKQYQLYRRCYEAVEQLRKDGKSVEDACALYAEEIHQADHTVRKIYYNWKRQQKDLYPCLTEKQLREYKLLIYELQQKEKELASNQRKTKSRKRT